MAIAEANKNYFDFSGGFNSDVSPLTFPPNTSVDEVNFPLRIDKERHRRKGMDYESSYSLNTQALATTDAVQAFDWHNVGNDPDTNFQVVQTGSTLHFYNKDASAISANKKSFTVDLTTRKVTGVTDANVKASPVQGVAGKGLFFVVGQYLEPFYIEYDSGGDSITLNRIFISARDFKGTEESVGIANRPTSLTAAHTYDLYNQGWTDDKINSFYASIGAYPSNVDRWEYGIYTDPSTGKETFSADELTAQNLGNTPAARGHFIYSTIFDTTESTDQSSFFSIDTYSYVAGTVTMTTIEDHGLSTSDTAVIQNNSFTYDNGGTCGSAVTDSLDGTYTVTVTGAKTFTFSKTITGWVAWCDQYTSKGYVLGDTVNNPNGRTISVRPEVVGFYAGRAWFSGINDTEIGSNLYFSQIAINNSQLGKCYQEADPTSEHISDLLVSDGGVIPIPEMGELLYIYPVGNSLVLFANNGVWSIEAGEKDYFTADSYSIRKITDVGCVSARSVVAAEGNVYYWSDSGIYYLLEDKVTGFLTSESVTVGRIETHLHTIPATNKAVVKGEYDNLNKELKWIYHTTSTETHKFSKELIYNLALDAWTKFNVDTTVGPYLIEMLHTNEQVDVDSKIKYLVNVDNTSITFAHYSNTNYLDWETYNTTGIDASAYIITAYELLDDAMRRKFANYIFCYLNRTEDTATADGSGDFILSPKSSCLMQARWDWTNNTIANKFSAEKQVYRFKRYMQPSGAGDFDNGHPVVVTKNKIRGSGKVLSLKFSTEASKDCQLLGWAVNFLGVTRP